MEGLLARLDTTCLETGRATQTSPVPLNLGHSDSIFLRARIPPDMSRRKAILSLLLSSTSNPHATRSHVSENFPALLFPISVILSCGLVKWRAAFQESGETA